MPNGMSITNSKVYGNNIEHVYTITEHQIEMGI